MSEAYHESRKMGTVTAAEVAKSKFEPEWGVTFSTWLEGGAMSSTYQVGGDHVHHEAGRRSDSLCGARKQSDILSRVRKWSDVIKEVELHQS